MTFALGQRYISDTESDLGLGTIVAVDMRTVTVLFAASEENRLYARSDAPITRVIFNVGDTIESVEGMRLIVHEVTVSDAGLITYLGVEESEKPDKANKADKVDSNRNTTAQSDNDVTQKDSNDTPLVTLREVFLSHQIRFNKPQDKLFAGQIERMERFVLRYQALTHQYAQHKSPMRGLSGMRAGLIPHQLYVAHEVGRRHAPRVLLADEVGLGKTIEAGMIIHQQVLSGSSERVLIIVPETLQHQWLVEMLRRFNLHFSIFDEERCEQSDLDGINPFESQQYVLCSLDFLQQHSKRYEQMRATSWDLMVVDEAHHLHWSVDAPSHEYQIIEGLANQISGVLLLTATPEQLGHESHFARLRLLDSDRFFDYDAFVKEEQQYAPVADAVSELMSNKPLSQTAKNHICELLSEQDAEPLFRMLDTDQVEIARQELIDNLMDRHGTGRILFRNTRAAIKGFPQRNLHFFSLPMPTQYERALRVSSMMDGDISVGEKAIKKLYPEEILQKLEGDKSSWWAFDPRVDWLLDKVLTKRGEKILVIASKASTALQLEQALREREGVRASVFHEGMSILERDKAAAYFAQEEGGAQVMICSEIGSEGRNFQFAHLLVMFDLPDNPDLLEQRIGRLDRIGQTRDIDVYVPFLQGSAQARLAYWYHYGLNAFKDTCPTGRAVYEQFSDALIELLASDTPVDDLPESDLSDVLDDTIEAEVELATVDNLGSSVLAQKVPRYTEIDISSANAHHEDALLQSDSALVALVDASAKLNHTLSAALEHGRDRLLEVHSNGGDKAKQIAADIAALDNDTDLVSFALNLFDTIGLNQDDKGENAIVLTPTEHMLVPSYPGLPYDGATITFDRPMALSREELHFMSWEHPMIQGGIDLLLSERIGSNAVSLLKNKALPVGTVFVEFIYVVDAQAPKNSGINQFLPTTPIRLLLDAKGNDLSPQVTFDAFNRQLSPINRHMASKVVNSVQAQIHALIAQSEVLIQPKIDEVRDAALVEMKQTLHGELDRLQALKAVNPNIRDEELAVIEENIAQLSRYITGAQWQLDALRLIVVSHQ